MPGHRHPEAEVAPRAKENCALGYDAAMANPSATEPLIRPVRAGDEIVVAVEGGFVRRAAQVDGLVVETPERDVFLPVDTVLDALRVLGRIVSEKR